MKKFLIFVFSFLLISFVLGEATLAATDAGQSSFQFKPQVQIPGTDFAYPEVTLMTGDAIGSYIVSLYKYGAGIAGLVALFMIVLAGWKWLMAAGNSEKISTAKDTIQGALIGLFLLFGGYLLLSQISTSLVEFDTLNLPSLETVLLDEQYCQQHPSQVEGANLPNCGSVSYATTSPITGTRINCISNYCGNVSDTAVCLDVYSGKKCKSAGTITDTQPNCACRETQCSKINFWVWDPDHKTSQNNCYGYKSVEDCVKNVCLNQQDVGGNTMTNICGWDGYCKPLEDVGCNSNADCNQGPDGSAWCCEKQSFIFDGWNRDECKRISETDNCHDY